MQRPLILWMNCMATGGTPVMCRRLERHCRVRTCDSPDAPLELVSSLRPDVLCFDFADPEAAQLALVQKTKLEHPRVPILIFTTSRSADLLVWALRTRIWDCFIKPVSCGEVVRRLNLLLPVLGANNGQRARKLVMPERGGFAEAPAAAPEAAAGRTAAVLPFLQRHFHEKIALSRVADICGMDAFEFSRCFRREQGVTFRDYLISVRIEAAARRLRRDHRSVLDVACSVGFNDPSHFARLFRRHVGVTPSVYRNVDAARSAAPPGPAQKHVYA
jgi:AraC-like DNA-binding protein